MAVLMDDNTHKWGIFNCHVSFPGGKCCSSGSGRAGARALSCWSASLHFAPTFSFLTKTCTLISTCRIVFCLFWLPYIICPWVVFAWLGQRWEEVVECQFEWQAQCFQNKVVYGWLAGVSISRVPKRAFHTSLLPRVFHTGASNKIVLRESCFEFCSTVHVQTSRTTRSNAQLP